MLERADTVLLVGVNTPWYPSDAYPNKDGRVILLDEDTAESRMPHWSYQTHMRLSGDLGSTLSALTDAVKTLLVDSEGEKVHFKARFRRWQQEHEEMVAEWRSAGQKQKSGAALTPAGFLSVRRYCPKKCLDTG